MMARLIRMAAVSILVITAGALAGAMECGAFDAANWHGVVLADGGAAFAFRFVIRKGAETADGYDTFFLVHDVGPIAPNGSYAEVSFDTALPFGKKSDTPLVAKRARRAGILTLRWARQGDGVTGRVSIPPGIRVEIVFYNPWDGTADYTFQQGRVQAAMAGKLFQFVPAGLPPPAGRKEGLELRLELPAGCREFHFTAGADPLTPSAGAIDKFLRIRQEAYLEGRPAVTGEWAGITDAIGWNLGWMRLWQPDRQRVYLPAGRRWIFPSPGRERDLWTVFEWDAFFNALEAAVSDPGLARAEVAAVLDTQYPWGNIPNWRSAHSGSPDRSQPPVGAFAVLKTYLRCGDKPLLEQSYPALARWNRFWTDPGGNGTPRRDGNANGLLEWGSDADRLGAEVPEWEKEADGRQRAAWESGQDDLPNYDGIPFDDRAGTLALDCLDLSSLYALDCECLARIAAILGDEAGRREFEGKYRRAANGIDGQLWDPEREFYFDRSWAGRWSDARAASNFYPLLAGIPAPDRARLLVQRLQNPAEFWGDFVVPTISRDHPAFKDQQYWRGTIWPPTNYLVYQGLKRYRFDEAAAEFARRSARLFLGSWETYRLCRENYNSMTGEGGGHRYQSWGPLFALLLLEEYIDISPFDGLRVGNLAAGAETAIRNLPLGGAVYDVEAGPAGLTLNRDGRPLLEFRGRAVLRQIQPEGLGFSAEAAVYGGNLRIRPAGSVRHMTAEVNGRPATVRSGWLELPAGTCKIVMRPGALK